MIKLNNNSPNSKDTSSDSWSLIDIIVDPMVNNDQSTSNSYSDARKDPGYLNFITSCRDDSMNSFYSSESVILKNPDQSFIRQCYVDGFNEAATNNRVTICKHIYSKRHVMTGMPINSAIKTVLKRHHLPTNIREIDPNIFILCCERNAFDVVPWMLGINTFNPLVIKIGFETACYKESIKIMNILYDDPVQKYIKQYLNDPDSAYTLLRVIIIDKHTKSIVWFKDKFAANKINIHLVFTKLCKHESTNTVACFLDYFDQFLQKTDIYNVFVRQCSNGGDIDTLKLLRERYSIDDCIFNDTLPCGGSRLFNEIMNNKFLDYSHQIILEWINTFKKINIKIKRIDDWNNDWNNSPVLSVINISGYDVDKCLESLRIKINAMQFYNFDKICDLVKKTIIDASISPENKPIEQIIEISSPLIKKDNSIDTIIRGTVVHYYLCVMIWVESFVNSEQLFNLLLQSDTYGKKEMVAKLMGYHLNRDLSYKEIMIDRLGLLVADEESLANTGKIFKSAHNEQYQTECPVCMCEYDMILSCGHVMCMTCAYKWYIQKSNQLMCQICRRSIQLSSSYCLI